MFDFNQHDRPSIWRCTTLALAGLLFLLLIAGFVRSLPLLTGIPDQMDLQVYYDAASSLNEGRPLYVPNKAYKESDVIGPGISSQYAPVNYPPLAYILFRPLATLPLPIAKIFWYVTNIIMLFVSFLIVSDGLNISAFSSWINRIGIFFLLLITPPVLDTLHLGQMSILILLLSVLPIYFLSYHRNSSKFDVISGISIGIASAIKVYPIIFGLFFAFHRRTSTVLSMLSTLLITGTAGVIFGGGWSASKLYVSQVLPDLSSARVTWPDNQSLSASLGRLFTVNHYRLPIGSKDNIVTISVYPIIESARIATVAHTALVSFIIVATIFAMYLNIQKKQQLQSIRENYALAVILPLLISPIVWPSYHVMLLLPFLVLWKYYGTRSPAIVPLLLSSGTCILLHRFWVWTLRFVVSPWLMSFGFVAVFLLWVCLLSVALGWGRLAQENKGLSRDD